MIPMALGEFNTCLKYILDSYFIYLKQVKSIVNCMFEIKSLHNILLKNSNYHNFKNIHK